MKNVVCHSNYPVLNKNGNMLKGVGDVSIKDFLYQMKELKRFGESAGLFFRTSAEVQGDAADAYLFIDMPEAVDPYYVAAINSGKPMYLLAWESDIINSGNSISANHGYFEKVFTYDDSLVGTHPRYVKVSYSFEFPDQINRKDVTKNFCCMIAANKVSNNPRELYTSRRQIIEMHEKSELNDFDLYGFGWDKVVPPRNTFDKILNRLPFKFIKKYPKVYRGQIDGKLEVLEKYKFSVCYENAYGSPGYISEKIFDCFFAGCVPIYLGAPNIDSYIPSNCFIDPRKYPSIREMFANLRALSSDDYNEYQGHIDSFLISQRGGIFCVSNFCSKLIEAIL